MPDSDSSLVFTFQGIDGPGAASLREEFLAEHLAFVADNIERYLAAGPLKGPDGEMFGSLYLVFANDEADARAFMAGDPYLREDVFESLLVCEFVAAAGSAVGGITWESA